MISNQQNNTIQYCQVEIVGRKSDFKFFKETNLEVHPKIKLRVI